MPLEPLTDFPSRDKADDDSDLFADLSTIRILVYTDDPIEVTANETGDFGIGLMKKFLSEHQPAFAKTEVDLISRNSGKKKENHATEKLTKVLPGGNYDQIWFFGIHLSNLSAFHWSGLNFKQRGGPESELTEAEVIFLKEWMRGNGVLVTGDHSEPPFATATFPDLPERPELVSLGRALGHKVPRARLMRTWVEGPASSGNNHDTLEANAACPDAKCLEGDIFPQRIIPVIFEDEHERSPRPHYTFAGDKGVIVVFPDHMHEGKILEPNQFDDDDEEWPEANNGGPRPFTVAYGTDKRNGNVYRLVAVYEGDTVGLGRVVADSTWHHYFNENLKGFDQNTADRSVADRIGQYYRNLAVWLSPLSKRQKMARAMFWWLATRPRIVEELSSDPLRTGMVAGQLLSRVAAPDEVNELLLAYSPLSLRKQERFLSYPEKASTLSHLPSRELILGSVINEYYIESAALTDPELRAGKPPRSVSKVIADGFAAASAYHAEMLELVAEQGVGVAEHFTRPKRSE
jgi:hypothetical protein